MRVLVTGHLGYIGTVLTPMLVRAGHEVVGFEFADNAGPDKRSYRVSFEKIRRRLPTFKPRWDARMGAEQLYKAYRASNLTLQEFEGPRYQRIGHQKEADGGPYPRY